MPRLHRAGPSGGAKPGRDRQESRGKLCVRRGGQDTSTRGQAGRERQASRLSPWAQVLPTFPPMRRRHFQDCLLTIIATTAGGCAPKDYEDLCSMPETVWAYQHDIDTATACQLAGEQGEQPYRQPTRKSCKDACQSENVTNCFVDTSYLSLYDDLNRPPPESGSAGQAGASGGAEQAGAGGSAEQGGAGGKRGGGPLCPQTTMTTVSLRCERQEAVYKKRNECYVLGRRPAGLLPTDAPSSSLAAIGAYFASSARLEAASVIAFERLEHDLARLGAPRRLRARARKAAADERRHASIATRLAERFGAEAVPAKVESGEPCPSAIELALENAIEGVVRETFGAAEALFRASRAGDEGVRRAMRRIAIDECGHAALSWDIASWLGSKLDARGKARVRRASRRAAAELGTALASLAPDEAERRLGGAPDATEARHLFHALDEALWRRGPRQSSGGAKRRARPAATLNRSARAGWRHGCAAGSGAGAGLRTSGCSGSNPSR